MEALLPVVPHLASRCPPSSAPTAATAVALACSPVASSRSFSATSTPPPPACRSGRLRSHRAAADQPCCGALMVHSGLEEQAAAMARRIIELFEQANVDTIVINAAGCGSTMKEYGHILRDDPAMGRARAAPSPPSAETSPRFSANSHLSRRAIPCPFASRITTPATSVMLRASIRNHGICSLQFLVSKSRTSPSPPSAAALPVSTISSNRSPHSNSAIARSRTCWPPRRPPSSLQIQAAFSN